MDEKIPLEKIVNVKKEISGTGCVKKPNSGQLARTSKEQSYKDCIYNPEVNDAAENSVSERNLKNIPSICSNGNSDIKIIDVSELRCFKELTSFCNWFENCVTEENYLLPEDLTLYNELKKEGKVLELDETWKKYYEQPVDVLNLLEETDLVNSETEIQELDQCLEDLDYIRSQLRCELQYLGQAIGDVKRKENSAELQLSESVKQCLIQCKRSTISLEQLISQIDSVMESFQFLTMDLGVNNIDCSGESSLSITPASNKSDLEKSTNSKPEKASRQASFKKYEAACSLFESSLDDVFCNFKDEVLCAAQCEDSENYRFHVTEDSDLHEFCRLQLSLSDTMIEHTQLACKKKALTKVIEDLQTLKEDVKTGNFKLSLLEIRMIVTNSQELTNLKSENETLADELCKVCTEWVVHHIKYALFDCTYSKFLAAGISDITIEKMLDAMLKAKATGDILIVMSSVYYDFVNAAVKLIVSTEESLDKCVSSLNEYKTVMESNFVDCHMRENSGLLKEVASVLGSDVSEVENTLKTVCSSISDQLNSVLMCFGQQYRNLYDIEYQLTKWWISVCDHCKFKSLQLDDADWIDECENKILEFQCRLEKLTRCLYENQEKITQHEENRLKRLKWILFLMEIERKKYDC